MTIYEKELRQKYPQFFEKQICKICGKEFYLKYNRIKAIVLSLKRGKNFFIACCNSHSIKIQQEVLGSSLSNPSVRDKARKTKEMKYGNPNYNNSLKCKQTKQERYNDPNYNNRTKCSDTKQRKYGDKNYNNRLQANNTMDIKYGNHYTKTNEFKENIKLKWLNKSNLEKEEINIKRRNTKQLKYNNPDYNNIQKCKNTKLIRYNDPNYNNKEKNILTTLAKWGVKHYSQTKEFKDLYKNDKWVKNKNDKHNKTMIKNKTYNRPSKSEDECYNLLLTKFSKNDIERPYMNDKYPFKCDFYIKSIDLYIECHFSQFHQQKPFDKNNKQDLIKLLCLQLKSLKLRKNKNIKNQYDFMIYTWTDLDPRKLQTFKKNNLNYKIFYNEEDFNEWFDNL